MKGGTADTGRRRRRGGSNGSWMATNVWETAQTKLLSLSHLVISSYVLSLIHRCGVLLALRTSLEGVLKIVSRDKITPQGRPKFGVERSLLECCRKVDFQINFFSRSCCFSSFEGSFLFFSFLFMKFTSLAPTTFFTTTASSVPKITQHL